MINKKRKSKQLLSVLLSLTMGLNTFPTMVYSEETSDITEGVLENSDVDEEPEIEEEVEIEPEEPVSEWSIQCTVQDESSGKKLSGVATLLQDGNTVKQISYENGQIEVNSIPSGQYTLVVTAEGYTSQTLNINLNSHYLADVKLTMQEFSITAASVSNGSIELDKSKVKYGESVTIKFKPDTNYVLQSATINGKTVTVENNLYTIASVTENITVSAVYRLVTYPVSIEITGNGEIKHNQESIAGNIQVSHGTQYEYSVIPSNGYHISELTVNGETPAGFSVNEKESTPYTGTLYLTSTGSYKVKAVFSPNVIYVPVNISKISESSNLKININGKEIDPKEKIKSYFGEELTITISDTDGYYAELENADKNKDGSYTYVVNNDDPLNFQEKEIEYTIKFYNEFYTNSDGNNLVKTFTYTVSTESLGKIPETSAIKNYEFVGWFKPENNELKDINENDKLTQESFNDLIQQKQNLEFYAVWRLKKESVSISVSGTLNDESKSIIDENRWFDGNPVTVTIVAPSEAEIKYRNKESDNNSWGDLKPSEDSDLDTGNTIYTITSLSTNEVVETILEIYASVKAEVNGVAVYYLPCEKSISYQQDGQSPSICIKILEDTRKYGRKYKNYSIQVTDDINGSNGIGLEDCWYAYVPEKSIQSLGENPTQEQIQTVMNQLRWTRLPENNALSFPMNKDKNILFIKAKDKAGNITYSHEENKNIVFFDNEGPEISLSFNDKEPDEGITYYNTKDVKLVIKIEDQNLGDEFIPDISINGKNITLSESYFDDTKSSWTGVVSLEEYENKGLQTIQVNAVDALENIADTYEKSFVIDTISPNILFGQTEYKEDQVLMTFDITESNLVSETSSKPDVKVEIKENNTGNSETLSLANESKQGELGVSAEYIPAEENSEISSIKLSFVNTGNYTIKIAATDLAKNTADSKEENICIDFEPMEVSFDFQAVQDTWVKYEDQNKNIFANENTRVIISITDADIFDAKVNNEDWTFTPVITVNGTEKKLADLTDRKLEKNSDNTWTWSASLILDEDAVISVSGADQSGREISVPSSQFRKDISSPVFTSVQLEKVNDTIIAKVLNFLSFGNFFNTQTRLSMSVNDGDTGSGVKKVTVCIDNEKYNAEYDLRNDIWTVLIPEKAEGILQGNLSLTAEDNVNNLCTPVTDFSRISNNQIQSGFVMFELDSPVINTNIDDITVQTDQSKWVFKDQEIVIHVSDKDSGLREVTISDNGNQVPYNCSPADDSLLSQQFTGEATYRLSYSDLNIGANSISIVAVDNCGNTREVNYLVYKDANTPIISSLTIDGLDNHWNDQYNSLTFGNFYNQDVIITAQLKDTGYSSGLNNAVLSYNGETYSPLEQLVPVSNTDGRGTEYQVQWTIPWIDKAGTDTLAIELTDCSGNKNEVPYSDLEDFGGRNNTNLKENTLLIEKNPPVELSLTPEKPAYEGKNNDSWYSSDKILFIVHASDPEAGIREVELEINGEKADLWDNYYQGNKPVKEISENDNSIKFYLSDYHSVEGENVLKITVTDNAGNSSSELTKVYIDTKKPVVQNLSFNLKDNNSLQSVKNAVEVTDYGFYFKKNVDVTIYVNDSAPTSGLKTVYWKTVNVNGEVKTGKGIPSGEINSGIDNKAEGSYIFTIPAGFKGQIYAWCDDNNGWTSDEKCPDKTIVESQEQHDSLASLNFSRPAAPYKTADGQDLYTGSVPLTMVISDSYSGIQDVEWYISYGGNTESYAISIDNSGKMTGDTAIWSKEKKDDNLVTEIKGLISVKQNYNDIKIKVKFTDRCGNTTEKSETAFSIDTTNPVISVVFDNNSPDTTYTNYFNKDRTATITVTERNFDPSLVALSISNTLGNIPAISGWKTISGQDNHDNDQHIATITFSADGDYQFNISCKDLGQHSSNAVSNSFTIDQTVPVISIALANLPVQNGDYYNSAQTATITVVERNFDPGRVSIPTTEDGANAAYSVGGWSTSGDTHTATITFSNDALYTIDASMTDMAGNQSAAAGTVTFHVDQTAPGVVVYINDDQKINIDGASSGGTKSSENAKGGAYSDKVEVRVECTDKYMNTDSVKLTRIMRDSTEDVSYMYSNSKSSTSLSGIVPDPEHEDRNDGIYTMEITITDMAGNQSTATLTYSVNRFGSVYVYSSDLKNSIGGYHQSDSINSGDLTITAYNANKIVDNDVKVSINIDGKPSSMTKSNTDAQNVVNSVNKANTTGNSGWYEYVFKIDQSDLTSDGKYEIILSDKDEAGNTRTTSDEPILFYVDNTAPVLENVNGLEEKRYKEENIDVNYNISDSIGLSEIKVLVNGEVKETISDLGSTSYTGTFNIDSGLDQTVQFIATDMAGNTMDTGTEKDAYVAGFVFNRLVTVSTNPLILLYANKPLFYTLVALIVIIIVGTALFFILKKRQKEEEEQKI